MHPTVADVLAAVHAAYDPAWAAPWDAVGLVCGKVASPVARVLVCVDVTAGVLAEADRLDAQMVLAHHPLLLHGVHGVEESGPPGALLARLLRDGRALLTAHTNADAARPGVSDALCLALGLEPGEALEPWPAHASSAQPHGRGLGRICELPEATTPRALAAVAADRLLARGGGVRLASAEPDREVTRVAVAAGACDDLIETAHRAGVHLLLTSDLRHHRTRDGLDLGLDLIDVPHWAAERPWLDAAAHVVQEGLAARGLTVDVAVSTDVGDPWIPWT